MGEHDLDETRLHDGDATRIHRTPPPGQPSGEQALSSAGDYTLHQRLGTGGFAEVYLAEDRRTGRQVALKRLLPGPAASDEIVHRFRSVAERTRELTHPNIVTVYGFEIVDGRPAIIMEYVPGSSLRQILSKRGALPVDEVLSIALPLCDALIHAHEHGFIHRDVKPDNVLITPGGVPKLSDFDIAKITVSTALTLTGVRLGTPYYMSPEQVRGRQDVDARSDVFSMGAVLYEMVTGEVPMGRFDHPSELAPGLSRRLGSVILKALARDRGVRYDNMQALRDALTGSPESRDAQERPFHFRYQTSPAKSIGDLVEYSERDWDSARWHHESGHYVRWLKAVDPKLAKRVQAAQEDESDSDLALERVLHLLDPTLPDPVLAVDPEFGIDLEEMAAHETQTRELRVSNLSRGYLVGSIVSDSPWISVNQSEFRLKEGESHSLTLLANAPEELGEYAGEVTLESNGGTIQVPVRLCTSQRLLFPEAGRSAGSVEELVELCNAYRQEATELFYDMDMERWLEEGPLRFDLVAYAQELRKRYAQEDDPEERAKGLRAFVLACSGEQPTEQEPFTFRTGDVAKTVPDLIKLCEAHWSDAEWHLYEGHFGTWLRVAEPGLVAETEHIRQTEKDRALGVERFLRHLNPDLPRPRLQVEPTALDLGSAAPGEKNELVITVQNVDRGYLSGTLVIPEDAWAHPRGTARPDLLEMITSLCPSCGSSQPVEANFCRRCGHPLKTFGCLTGESRSFRFVVESPDEIGEHVFSASVESNGGSAEWSAHLDVSHRLFFPEINLSVGSLEELAQAGTEHWKEVLTRWTEGDIREWLNRGLLRFDLIDTADRFRDNKALTVDMQLTRFLLQVCPTCTPWLPPCLETGQHSVNLGTVLRRSAPYRLFIDNLGGGEPKNIRVVRQPPWLEIRTAVEDASGITLELVGDTRGLKSRKRYERELRLEWSGGFGGARLLPQKLEVSVAMKVAPSLRIGRWRLPFDGTAQLGSGTIPVRLIWVLVIGLLALVPGVLIGLQFEQFLWAVASWLVLWLVGSFAWAIRGLGYEGLLPVIRDAVGGIKRMAGRGRGKGRDRE